MFTDATESSGHGATQAGHVDVEVLFSDKSTFCLFGNQAHVYVRRFAGEEFKHSLLISTQLRICGTKWHWRSPEDVQLPSGS